MVLKELLEIQSIGALSITETYSNGCIGTINGVELSSEDCKTLAEKLGFSKFYGSPLDAIQTANKVLGNIKNQIKSGSTALTAQVEFTSTRKSETNKRVERFILTFGQSDRKITVVSGLGGLGARYGIFDSQISTSNAADKCSSLKDVGVYLNNI